MKLRETRDMEPLGGALMDNVVPAAVVGGEVKSLPTAMLFHSRTTRRANENDSPRTWAFRVLHS